MSATEQLRKMLDERGVEWKSGEARPLLTQIRQDGHTIKFHAWQPGTLKVSMFNLTPEQAISATVGAGTCEADETELIPFVHADGDISKVDYIHVMECTECGHTYEHVNGDYEYCPRCGRKRRDFVE